MTPPIGNKDLFFKFNDILMELCKPIKLAPQTNQTNFSISISGIL